MVEMTNEELLIECKVGLNIPIESMDFDGILNQKIAAVKNYMRRAGVKDENIDPAAIVLGVTDLWNTNAGEVKFSPVFESLVVQLRGD